MKYALIHGIVLSGHADMQPEEKTVLIDGETIVGFAEKGTAPEGYTVVDLKGQYVMPGLINLHVHLPAGGRPKKGKTNYNALVKLLKLGVVRAAVKRVCAANGKKQMLSGTTTIRAVGGVMDFDTWLRDRIAEQKIDGPRILAANYAVSVPGGHMTGSVALPAHSPEEAAQMVRDLAETKPDLIKLMITGGVLDALVPGEPGILKMPAEYVKAACDEAHRLGYPVAAHVEGTEGMVVALENGVDTIEHGGKPTDETTALFRKTGAVLVCTLSPAAPFTALDTAITGMSETDLINGKAMLVNMVDGVNEALEAGVTVGLGTDTGCPFITHYDMWRELVYFAHYCHVSNAFALYTATLRNAQIAHIDSVTGSVEAGKCADLLITAQNPLENLQALRTPAAVICRGKLWKEPKIKKYSVVEENLDLLLDTWND